MIIFQQWKFSNRTWIEIRYASQQFSKSYKSSFERRVREEKGKKKMRIIARVKKVYRNRTIFRSYARNFKRRNTRVSLYDVSNKRLLNVDGREGGKRGSSWEELEFHIAPLRGVELRPRSRKSVHSSLRRLSQAIRKTSRTHLRWKRPVSYSSFPTILQEQ